MAQTTAAPPRTTTAGCSDGPPHRRPLRAQPESIPPWKIAAVGGFALACGLFVTLLLQYGRSRSWTGFVQADTYVVHSDCSGQVEQVLVRPGQQLRPGEQMLVLRDDARRQAIEAARAEVAQREAELKQAEARAAVELAWRMKAIEDELFQAQLQAANCLEKQFQSRLEGLAWNQASNLPQLVADRPDDVFRFVSDANQDDLGLARLVAILKEEEAKNQLEVSQAQLEICERRMKELESLKAELPEKVRQASGVEQAKARLQEAQQRLSRLEKAGCTRAVCSKIYGTVSSVTKSEGERVERGEPLVKLLDLDRCYVVVDVPTWQLSRIRPEQEVRLEFPGGEVRTGRIRRLPLEASIRKGPGIGDAQAAVTLRIEPAGKLWPSVPVGTAVRVWFE